MTAIAVLALLVIAGCGDDDVEMPAPDVVRDVRLLQRTITDDPALAPLEEADDAYLEDRPVLAAELLETGAIPAARRQVAAFEALEMSTPEGRRFRRRLIDAYERRVEAISAWRALLARAAGEDLELVEALGAMRRADEEVLDIDREMQEVRPIPEDEAEAEGEQP